MRLLPALVSALVCTLTTVDAFGVLPQSALWSETSAAKQCSADAGPGSAQAEAPCLAAGGAEGVGVRGVVSWRGERAGQVCYLRRGATGPAGVRTGRLCGRPHASRGAALLELGGPLRPVP